MPLVECSRLSQQAEKKKATKSSKKSIVGGSVKGSSNALAQDDDYDGYNDDDFM